MHCARERDGETLGASSHCSATTWLGKDSLSVTVVAVTGRTLRSKVGRVVSWTGERERERLGKVRVWEGERKRVGRSLSSNALETLRGSQLSREKREGR